MIDYKSLFLFNKKQQRGIFVLLTLLIVVVALRFYASSQPLEAIDLDPMEDYRAQIDSLRKLQSRDRDTIYPFNPNYITDYKAYTLGMSEEQIVRLERFRESGKFINNKEQFQQVTQVSQAWMDSISHYFKFPSWVNKPQSNQRRYKTVAIKPSNINTASLEQLQKVYGIGPALSRRIMKERANLDGFINMKQVRAVYGITDSTMLQLNKHFYITVPVGFKKIALNKASVDDLSTIPYLSDYLIDKLIEQRTLRDGFKSWDEVVLTSRFPQEKLPLIQLYLTID